MPIYEFQTSPPEALRTRGPCCPVEVSLPQTLIDQLTQRGQKIPPPESGNALIDTGASVSAVDLSIISKLRLNPIGIATVGTAGGPAKRNLYPARFILHRLSVELEAVIGANLKPFDIIALIGRDILSRFLLIYHGPAGRVTLTF